VNRKKIIIGTLIVVLAAALIGANLYFKRETGVEVQVEKVLKRDLEAIVSASGKIRAMTTVNISANTMGRVTKLAVEEGDRVKKGQFLLEIDPRSWRTQVERGEAGLSAQKVAVEQAKTAVESAKSSLKLAQDTYKRQQDLWKDQLTTREALDRAENDVRLRERDVESRQAEITMQTTRIRQNTADLDTAKYNLGQVSIDSPIDGIVTRRNIELGENVMIGTMNNAGTVLLTVADLSVIEAELEVDETDIPNVKVGQMAKVTIDAIPDKTFAAKVTEVGTARSRPRRRPVRRPSTSRSSSRSRTRSWRCGRASPARRTSRPPPARMSSRSRSRPPPCGSSSLTTRATRCGSRRPTRRSRAGRDP